MSADSCPHCGGDVSHASAYCRHCSRRVLDAKSCPTCKEPIHTDALFCPYCTQRIPTDRDRAAQQLDLEFRATHLGSLFTSGITGFFLPPYISISAGRIHVRKWSFLGLRCHHQELQVSRVASVRYTKGIFWGGILVETFGGSAEDIAEKGLRQRDARSMAEQLKSVLTQ